MAAREAINAIARGTRAALAGGVLDGLGLIDETGRLRPNRSPYARRYLKQLRAKPEPQVIAASLSAPSASAPPANREEDLAFDLEPEWTAVALLALVQNGDIVLTVNGKEALDAGNVDRAALIGVNLANFRHYGRTRTVPTERWARVFEVFGLSPGLVRDEAQREAGVEHHCRTPWPGGAARGRTARPAGPKRAGFGTNRSSPTGRWSARRAWWRGGTTPPGGVSLPRNQFNPETRAYAAALEKLGRFNSVGKLRNLDLQYDDIDDLGRARAVVNRTAAALDLVAGLAPPAAYLAAAQAYLPDDHPGWRGQRPSARRRCATRGACCAARRSSGPGPACCGGWRG